MKHSDSNGRRQNQHGCEGEYSLPPEARCSPRSRRHYMQNALFQIGARNARDAWIRWFKAELTHFENALGVCFRSGISLNDALVASTFPFFVQPRAHPSHQRVKPEDRFDKGV